MKPKKRMKQVCMPWAKEPHDKPLMVHLTEKQSGWLRARAAELGVSAGSFVRSLIAAAQQGRLTP